MFAQLISQSSAATNALFDQAVKGIKAAADQQRVTLNKLGTVPGDQAANKKLAARANAVTQAWEDSCLSFIQAGRATHQAALGLLA